LAAQQPLGEVHQLLADSLGPIGGLRSHRERCFFPLAPKHDHEHAEQLVEIRNALDEAVGADSSLAGMREALPLRWLELLDRLKEAPEPCLELKEVSLLAQRCGVDTEPDVAAMLAVAHNVGSVTYLQGEGLRDRVLLQPQWALERGAELLHVEASEAPGLVSQAQIKALWPREQVAYLVRLAIHCGLMVVVPGPELQYLVPGLLPETVPGCRDPVERSALGMFLDFEIPLSDDFLGALWAAAMAHSNCVGGAATLARREARLQYSASQGYELRCMPRSTRLTVGLGVPSSGADVVATAAPFLAWFCALADGVALGLPHDRHTHKVLVSCAEGRAYVELNKLKAAAKAGQSVVMSVDREHSIVEDKPVTSYTQWIIANR